MKKVMFLLMFVSTCFYSSVCLSGAFDSTDESTLSDAVASYCSGVAKKAEFKAEIELEVEYSKEYGVINLSKIEMFKQFIMGIDSSARGYKERYLKETGKELTEATCK